MKTRLITAAAIATLAIATLAGCSSAAPTAASNSDTAKTFVANAISGSDTTSMVAKGQAGNVSEVIANLKKYGAGCKTETPRIESKTEIEVLLNCAGTTSTTGVYFDKHGKILSARGEG
jgi:hypothetical protein